MAKPKNEPPAAPTTTRYRVTQGFNHPLVGGPIEVEHKNLPEGQKLTIREGRVEAGQVVEAAKLPPQTVAWGLENGFLVPVEGKE